MKTLEEITYEAGRQALADQESEVAGIRSRTGTVLAAHALVASFLGGTALRLNGLHPLEWAAVACLVVGLFTAAVLLGPWDMRFAVDAEDLYRRLYSQRGDEGDSAPPRWLAAAGFVYQEVQRSNRARVDRMSRLSATLALLMIGQTIIWLTALGLE